MHLVLVAARREQRRFVDQVLEIGAGETGARSCELAEIDISRERDLARVHLEDRLASCLVGEIDDDAAIEAPGPQQRLVEHVGLVGGGEYDDALAAGEAI